MEARMKNKENSKAKVSEKKEEQKPEPEQVEVNLEKDFEEMTLEEQVSFFVRKTCRSLRMVVLLTWYLTLWVCLHV